MSDTPAQTFEAFDALLKAFHAAELGLPVYDSDPPTSETVVAFLRSLDELGFTVVRKP